MTLSTKTVFGWECDCPLYPHNARECALRRRVSVEIPTDPEWRIVSRETDTSPRATDLPPEVYATPVGPDDVPVREVARLLAIPGAHGTYARGFPPGEMVSRGECPACHKSVLVKLDGDLRVHKCISDQAAQDGRGAMQPIHDTIRPVPVESFIIRGRDWRIVYENNKFYQGWVINDGVWTQVDAPEAKRRALH